MHLPQVVVSLVLFIYLAHARLSHRDHGELTSLLKHKRLAPSVNNETALRGYDNELQKRDGAKYVFMHHVRRLIAYSLKSKSDPLFVLFSCHPQIVGSANHFTYLSPTS